MNPTVTAPITPGDPVSLYIARRRAGNDHGRAVAETAHAYGRSRLEIEQICRSARVQADSPELVIPEPPVEEIVTPPAPDSMDAVEVELKQRAEDLRESRRRLSLDARTDPDARRDLDGAEVELAEVERELQHLSLARAEQERREVEEAEQGRLDAVDDAQARAALLGTERDGAEKKLLRAAGDFGKAAANVHRLGVLQARALTEAGVADAGRRTTPSPDAFRRVLAGALIQQGAPNFLS